MISLEISNETRQQLIARIRERSTPMMPEMPQGVSEELKPMENVKAVLFDVYGTLFISGSGDIGVAQKSSKSEAMAEALRLSGFDSLACEGEAMMSEYMACIAESHAEAKGRGVNFPEVEIREVAATALSSLSEKFGRDASVTPESVCRFVVEYECLTNPVWPMPNLQNVFDELRARNLPLGIVSNAQFYTPLLFPALAEKDVEAFGFDDDLCVWSYKAREGKPSENLFPSAFEALATKYDILPENTVYVGNDCLNDIWTAQQAGCRTILFAGDRRSLRMRETDERCRDISPDATITDLSQLLQLI